MEKTLHANHLADGMPETADECYVNKAAHGVSIVEVAHVDGNMGICSRLCNINRRITADTEMDIRSSSRS